MKTIFNSPIRLQAGMKVRLRSVDPIGNYVWEKSETITEIVNGNRIVFGAFPTFTYYTTDMEWEVEE